MKTFEEALNDFSPDTSGGYKFEFGDGYELAFEKLIFNNQYYVALYKDKNLLVDKVVVKPGK